jgi:glucose/arabinose dehydrogenase
VTETVLDDGTKQFRRSPVCETRHELEENDDMILRAASLVLIASLVFSAQSSAQPPPANVLLPGPGAPLELPAGRERILVSLVVDGLIGPWDIEFLPDGSMLVTESPGALRIVRNGRLLPDPVWQAPSPAGNDVLHGLVIHPEFDENGLVYTSYTKERDDGLLSLAVSRGRLDGNRLADVEEIFVADAWTSARNATAGRMLFGPDGTLYVTVGDRDNVCCGPVDDYSIRIHAQSLDNHIGKTLRMTDDGRVPDDNPFVDTAGADPYIYTYGNRNGYGLAFHPDTGEFWQLEIGPMGGDELNILVPGGNYGWPLVSMGRNYSGTLASDQPWYRPGMENPRMFWVPAISPSSIEFYTGDAFPDWRGSLFVTALSGQHVERVAFGLSGQSERRDEILSELGVRFRDVEQGPDGFVYLATEVRYGSGNPDGTIIRLEPLAD